MLRLMTIRVTATKAVHMCERNQTCEGYGGYGRMRTVIMMMLIVPARC